MSKRFLAMLIAACTLSGGFLVGCEGIRDALKTGQHRFFAPEDVIEPQERPAVNPILPSIGMGDTHQELVPNATFPREGDWSYTERDYIIGAEDVLDISVLDLFQQGLETVLRRQVSRSGFVDLPLLPERIKAEGLTAQQLKQAIQDAYRGDFLKDPTVSVSVVAKRQNTYSILGAVNRPGTYNIIRKDMRLLEAIATAGGVVQSNIRYIYVIRQLPAGKATPLTEPGADAGAPAELPRIPEEVDPREEPGDGEPEGTPLEPEGGEPVEPGEDEPTDAETEEALREIERLLGQPSTRPAPEEDTAPPSVLPPMSETAATGPTTGPTTEPSDMPAPSRRVRWIYSDGRWIPVEQEAPPAETPPGDGVEPDRPPAREMPTRKVLSPREGTGARDPYGWREVERLDMARVIAINLSKLREGDPRMNIVVRDNDTIHIPTLEVGEFYVGGEVLRPGVYSLTGRRVTVKQAVTAAGNLGPLAWPENTVLIRRLGNDQEQMLSLDLEAIFQGEEPDIFLRPDDMVMVGTDWRQSFYPVLRNAFRLTYGFGFIYDRNFADPLTVTPTSRRFTRW